ncbi:hypothetical protein [Nesterenkonia sp. Act20]|uniref:hypothetical protein n=1 Tax=Nesterenkonia sp. Act20 TaxID=1483432 RepID=UPI001C4592C9|nr:hypothetical protein [Nesterenkonia sp. Act20]
MLGIAHTESAFLAAVEGLPIPSSALIALIAVLFLGTLVLRGQRQDSSYAAAAQASSEETPITAAHPHIHRGANMSANTESSPGTGHTESAESRTESATAETPSPVTAPSTPASTESTDRASTGFHLHWGRITVALIGVLALLSAVVTGILTPLTALPVAVPLASGGVFLLALVTMRTMAVVRRRRSRRRRVQAAIDEAMNPPQARPWESTADKGLFDALSADERGAGGPNSLQQIDEDGLPVGLERTFSPEHADSGPVLGTAAEPIGPWQPRAVPRPKYLDLDKAERLEPAPLPVEAPAPTSDAKLTQRRFVETPAAAEETPPQEDSLNLDEVLKRRRA